MTRARAYVFAMVAAGLSPISACTLLNSLDGLTGSESSGDSGTSTDGTTSDGSSKPDTTSDANSGADAGGSRYAAAVLTDQPLLYYRFGEPAGMPAKDEATGTTMPYPVQGVTQGAAGALVGDTNTAVSFDGTGGIDLSQDTDFEGLLPFSVEVWLSRATTVAEVAFAIDHESWTAEGRSGWLVLAGKGGFGFERWLAVDGANGNNSVGAAEPQVTGEWHHVVGTYDGTVHRLYVDSVRRDTQTTALPLPKIGTPFTVGKQNCTPCSATGFVGTLDELAIYSHALSEARILAHFNAGKNL